MVRRFWQPLALLAAGALLALPWTAADGGSRGSCHCSMRCSHLDYFDRLVPSAQARSGGDALGSIQETVGLLLSDPTTDWSDLRVSRLRQHLADLGEIVSRAEVDERPVDGGLAITAGGSERTLAALRRAVPEHVRASEGFMDWEVTLRDAGGALELTITTDDAGEVAVVRGLGFFGYLASGVNRPQSHLGVVRGRPAG
jgi:hypothetical protein